MSWVPKAALLGSAHDDRAGMTLQLDKPWLRSLSPQDGDRLRVLHGWLELAETIGCTVASNPLRRAARRDGRRLHGQVNWSA